MRIAGPENSNFASKAGGRATRFRLTAFLEVQNPGTVLTSDRQGERHQRLKMRDSRPKLQNPSRHEASGRIAAGAVTPPDTPNKPRTRAAYVLVPASGRAAAGQMPFGRRRRSSIG